MITPEQKQNWTDRLQNLSYENNPLNAIYQLSQVLAEVIEAIENESP